ALTAGPDRLELIREARNSPRCAVENDPEICLRVATALAGADELSEAQGLLDRLPPLQQIMGLARIAQSRPPGEAATVWQRAASLALQLEAPEFPMGIDRTEYRDSALANLMSVLPATEHDLGERILAGMVSDDKRLEATAQQCAVALAEGNTDRL